MKSLNDYLLSKGISIDDLADKYRDEILNKRLFPESKAIDYIRKDFQDLDNDGIRQLVDKVLEPIYKEGNFQYDYFLFTLVGEYCNYINVCNEAIGDSRRKIEEGVDVEFNKDWIGQQELEIKDTNTLISLLDSIFKGFNEKKNFISVAFLKKYVHESSGDLTYLLFPVGSKYESYYLVVPDKLIESNEHYIHEEYVSFNEDKRWIVLPEDMSVTLRRKGYEEEIIISTKELKEAVKEPFVNQNSFVNKKE